MTTATRHLIEQTVDAHVESGAEVLEIHSQVIATRPPPNHDIIRHDVL